MRRGLRFTGSFAVSGTLRPLPHPADPHVEPALIADEHHLDDLVVGQGDRRAEDLAILFPPASHSQRRRRATGPLWCARTGHRGTTRSRCGAASPDYPPPDRVRVAEYGSLRLVNAMMPAEEEQRRHVRDP